jgi:hypothetical protein
MDGLETEYRAVVFIAIMCTQEWSTAINSKLGSTKLYQTADSYTLTLPYVEMFFLAEIS